MSYGARFFDGNYLCIALRSFQGNCINEHSLLGMSEALKSNPKRILAFLHQS